MQQGCLPLDGKKNSQIDKWGGELQFALFVYWSLRLSCDIYIILWNYSLLLALLILFPQVDSEVSNHIVGWFLRKQHVHLLCIWVGRFLGQSMRALPSGTSIILCPWVQMGLQIRWHFPPLWLCYRIWKERWREFPVIIRFSNLFTLSSSQGKLSWSSYLKDPGLPWRERIQVRESVSFYPWSRKLSCVPQPQGQEFCQQLDEHGKNPDPAPAAPGFQSWATLGRLLALRNCETMKVWYFKGLMCVNFLHSSQTPSKSMPRSQQTLNKFEFIGFLLNNPSERTTWTKILLRCWATEINEVKSSRLIEMGWVKPLTS